MHNMHPHFYDATERSQASCDFISNYDRTPTCDRETRPQLVPMLAQRCAGKKHRKKFLENLSGSLSAVMHVFLTNVYI